MSEGEVRVEGVREGMLKGGREGVQSSKDSPMVTERKGRREKGE